MRIAILSDIHGNLTAFEAVLADMRQMAPDQILHGGDLADSGSSPAQIVDCIRDLGWPGVMGNTDEMLVRPESLEEFASQSSAPVELWASIREIAAATREALGRERLEWLRNLPLVVQNPPIALVHASPDSCWRAPTSEALDSELESIYGSLAEPFVVYGHTHRPFFRPVDGLRWTLINTGSVGLSYDGDPRASYLLLDGDHPTIRRVEYDLARELAALERCGLPGAEWTARMLRTASPQLP